MGNFEVTTELWKQLEQERGQYSFQQLRSLYLEEFLENTRGKKTEILERPDLIDHIRTAIKEGPWEGHNNNFYRLGNGLALKARIPEDRRIALAVKASLYHPGIPSPAFAVIINQSLKHNPYRYLYLVEDLGKLVELTKSPTEERIKEQIAFLDAYLESRGYYQNNNGEPLKPYGINQSVAIIDLDCREFYNITTIFSGVHNGRGTFGDLKDIFSKLKKYELNI